MEWQHLGDLFLMIESCWGFCHLWMLCVILRWNESSVCKWDTEGCQLCITL